MYIDKTVLYVYIRKNASLVWWSYIIIIITVIERNDVLNAYP